jgi:PRC-barrel domain
VRFDWQAVLAGHARHSQEAAPASETFPVSVALDSSSEA